jgi:hypothetical protein
MLKDSSVLAALEQVAYNPAGGVLCIYGDQIPILFART